jgi:RNA polymerase sigma-70 factor, ECF subfamily
MLSVSEIPSDEQVVLKVLNGDTNSFGIIVNRYQSYIFSIGMRFFKNPDDADDFVQDVFLRAYSELGSFKRKSPFRSWLIRIAYNYGINRVKAGKIDSVAAVDILSDHSIPEKDAVMNESINLLRDAIAALPEQYRICVDLYFFMGLKYTEIEKITGYPVNTIKSNVFRAKQLLRDQLRGSIAEDYHEM